MRQRPAAVHREALAGDDANVLGGCMGLGGCVDGWLKGVYCSTAGWLL